MSTETQTDQDTKQTEVQEFLDARQQRRWIFPRAALVGLCAGSVALLFRVALSTADKLRNQLILWSQDQAAEWILPVLLSLLGAVLAVYLTRKFAPEAPEAASRISNPSSCGCVNSDGDGSCL